MSEQSYAQLAGVGDVVAATFQFSGHDTLLETWFYEYLGREFREHYQGQDVFLGRIHTMRLAYNRLSLTVSLDWLFNRVACAYTSALDNSTLYTSFTTDTGSQSKWGRRETILRPSETTIGLAEAEEMAADFLADFTKPRISRGEVGQLAQAQLQVTVQGYSQTLDNQLHREEVEGEDDADAEVKVALEKSYFLTQGRIEANGRQVSIQTDWVSLLKRMEWLAGRRDSLGRRYIFGCFGSKAFDYQPVDDVPKYLIWTKRQQVEHYTPTQDYVPAPLVMPGGYSLVADLGVRTADEWNPALQWDASVQYDVNGATLRGGAWGVQERTAALQMALTAKRI